MRYRKIILASAISVLCCGCGRETADNVSVTAGDVIVVTADPEAELRDSSKVVATVPRGNILQVEKVDGNRCWVEWEHEQGWIEKADIVTLEKAADYFTRAIRRTPDADSYHSRALVWLEMGELEKALADLNEVLRLDAQDAYAYNNRGRVWDGKEEYDKAIADYNQALRLDPQNVFAYYNRGLAWDSKGEYGKAIDDFTKAIRLDPKDPVIYNDRGNALYSAGKYDEAIDDFNAALQLDPNYSVAYFNRGNAWDEIGEYDRAIADYNEYLRHDSTDTDTYINRALVWSKTGANDKAIADYNEVLRLDPKHAEASEKLAWLMATSTDSKYRDGERAVQLATTACELTDWKDAYYIDTLAAAYAEAGNFEKAVEFQQQAVSLAPPEAKADYRDRLALYKSGEPYRE